VPRDLDDLMNEAGLVFGSAEAFALRFRGCSAKALAERQSSGSAFGDRR
jgi:hypothetical protein